MKKINFILPAIAAMALATSCSSDDDKVVLVSAGNINLSGQYVTYMHGYQGWTAEDEIGVFVSSEDAEQANIKYVPSEVCPVVENKWVPGVFSYDEDNKADGQVVLKSDDPAQFYNTGDHGVYAYVPYQEGNTNYKTVALPSQAVQEYGIVNTFYGPLKKYCFAYAKTNISSYSSAVNQLEFETPFIEMTITSPEMPDNFIGKKVTKVTVSAPIDIAVDEATIDLSTGKVSGKLSKSVELTLPAGGLEIKGGYWGASVETLYLSLYIAYETAIETEFTFSYTIDGKEYSVKKTPKEIFHIDGNISVSGLTIE